MTEFEIAAEADREAAASCGVLAEFEAAEAEIARCHAITGPGHGPAVPNRIAELEMLVASLSAAVDASDRERDAAETAALIHKRDAAELERQVSEQAAVILDLRVQMADLLGGNRELTGMIDRVDQELAAMTAERDHALLRMEVAIATSNGLLDAEVRRRIAEAEAGDNSTPQNPRPDGSYGTPQHDPEAPGNPPPPHSFPSRALRHQRQSGGLLSTADAGRVRLGGYAPSLPPR